MKKTVLNVNIAEFLAEFFMNRTGEKVQFSYGLFWDAFHKDYGTPESINGPDEDSNLYYEYGLLKAEEEMEGDHEITERWLDNCSMWSYELKYYNADGIPLSIWFYTKTRIMAFIQQKPILCLESHTRLFRSALDSIMEAYSKGEYSSEDLLKEHCPSNSEVAVDLMRYKFIGSHEYITEYCYDGYAIGNNVGNAIDAAWTWFHTGFVNNFISKDPETNLLHLNW